MRRRRADRSAAQRWAVAAAILAMPLMASSGASAAVEPLPPIAGPAETLPPDDTSPDETGSGSATVDVTVDVGVRGYGDPGESLLVTVTVDAAELFDGRVEVRTNGAVPVSAKELQVPGGTTKTVRVLAPASTDGSQIEVRLIDDDGVVSTRRAQMRSASAVEIVGILPQLFARSGDLPDQVNLVTDTGAAELTELTAEVLSLGPLALDVFDSIAASGADLAALGDGERSALFVWVHEGGRLLLDDGSGTSVLPETWQPGTAGYALVGAGEVRLVDGAASRGEYRSIIQPSPDLASESINQGREMMISPQSELATRAGVKLPALGPLLLGLLVYALVIGPVVYLVLRKARRLTAAWVVLPALAVVTTIGITASGDRFRSTGSPATATLVETSAGGASAITNVLTFSRAGGDRSITAPAGWNSDATSANWFGFEFGSTGLGRLDQDDDASRVEMELDPGQVVTVALTGETAAEALTTTARIEDDTVVGTVMNETPFTLHDVAVFTSGGAESIPDLAPGESADWTIDAPERNDPFSSLAQGVWGNPEFGIGFEDSPFAEFGIWGLGDMRYGLYLNGVVRVAGWTTERVSDADPGSSASDLTVITTRQPIAPGSAPLHAAAVRAQTARTPFGAFGNGFGDTVMRYVLPPESIGTPTAQKLVVDLSSAGFGAAAPTEVDIWDGTTWVTVETDDEVAPIPDDSVIDGVVLVRIDSDVNGGGFDPSFTPVVRGSEEDES